ncbi:MAG: class I SAM-dependent methyltransferase [Nitrosotalea sp.]
MVQFDKVPLTRRYVKKALKFALSHPKIALLCLLLGIGPYMTLQEYKIAKKFLPKNMVEEKMVTYSDTWQHIPTLYLLCMMKKPMAILELGFRTGNTALPLLYAAQQYGGHVYSVDIEEWPEVGNFFDNKKSLEQYWTFIKSDDLKLDWNVPVDFIYVDTSHSYEHTMSELKKYEPLLKSGGVMAFHDIFEEEISNAIDDYFKDRKDIHFIRYFNNNGLGVILKD